MREQPDEAVTRILEARARALAEPAPAAPEHVTELLLFSVGDVLLATPTDRVREVLPPGPTTRLPVGAHALAGVRAVRGDVVAVADVASLLGDSGNASPPASSRFAVVLHHDDSPLGVLADRVTGVARAPGPLQAAPDMALIESITGDGVLVLDVDAVLSDQRLTSGPAADGGGPTGGRQ